MIRRRALAAACATAAVAVASAVIRDLPMRNADAAAPPAAPRTATKIVLVGDSMMGQVAAAVGAAVGQDRAPYVLTIGTANVQDDWWDVWPRVMDQERPDAVAVLVGPWELDRPDLGSYPWLRWYTARLNRWADQLTTGGARLYWILPPSVRDAEAEHRMSYLRAAYRNLAARRGDIRVIDADQALAGRPGYVERAPDGQRLRRIDGLHLCPLGAELIGTRLLDTVDVPASRPGWTRGQWRTEEPAYSPTECA